MVVQSLSHAVKVQRRVDAHSRTTPGTIDRAKWSYNSACYYQAMRLRPGRELPLTLVDTLTAMKARWIDPSTKLVKNPGMFGMHFMEAVALDSPREVEETVSAVFANCRNDQGLLGEQWNRKPKPNEQLKLMYTASLLRTSLVSRKKP